MNTAFSRLFSLELPLVVAPMGGGPTTPELVAASCEAGALGSLACAYMTPDEIRGSVEKTRALTSRPFALNLFTPMPSVQIAAAEMERAVNATRPYREELGLAAPAVHEPFHPDFSKQFEVMLELRPRVFSFVFGTLPRDYLRACRDRGILTMGTATTVEEGRELEQSGVDFISAQGVEAGGHRGLFDPAAASDPGVQMLDLTKSLVQKVRTPVIAAGGIMNGKGLYETLAAGASAAQMGTAFLLCPEAGTSKPYREALQGSQSGTRLTRVFSGRWARGLPNRFMNEMEKMPEAVLPFPAQNAFTRDLRKKSNEQGTSEFLSLWAGIGCSELQSGVRAQDLIHKLKAELEAARN